MKDFVTTVLAVFTVAILASLAVSELAMTATPGSPSSISFGRTATTITTTGALVGNSSIKPTPSPPALLLGELIATNVSCSLATGVCTMTIANNSNASLDLVACEITVIASSGGGVTEVAAANGTMGGPATTGIGANSQVSGTCTVPTSQLSHQASGSAADGGFEVKLADRYYSYPAGSDASFGFEGTWS